MTQVLYSFYAGRHMLIWISNGWVMHAHKNFDTLYRKAIARKYEIVNPEQWNYEKNLNNL